MKHFQIECGVSRPSGADAISMDVQGAAKNVKLRVDYITRPMLRNVPDLLIDLLEVAAYVYCADQRLGRGSETLPNFGEDWRRCLHFSIPVRHPEIWQGCDIHEFLTETLGFLSDDTYTFEFRKADAPLRPRELYFSDFIEADNELDEVALFSGGLDSMAGAVEDIVLKGLSVTLVGHYSSTKIRNIQETLVDELKRRGHGRRVSYIPVWVTNTGVAARECSQRARSFLFACLGLVIARMSGRDRFSFYENGVVSINLPIAGDIMGGRATRTTHPKVLRGLESLFSTLLDQQVEIRTPLHWCTKSEVALKLREAGLADLLAMTSSCTRPRIWTKDQHHCGVCSQCIDRRFAILAAGLEDFEPANGYMGDLLTSERSGNDLRVALSYVALYQKIGATPRQRFLIDFPQIVCALGSFPGLTAEQTADRLYDLFQRQAKTVEAVITEGTHKNLLALYRNELPPGSLLSVCFSRGHVESAPPSDYDAQAKAFVDRLLTPVLEFAVDTSAGHVLFRGGLILKGANFKAVGALLGNFRKAKASNLEVPFLPPTALADRLQCDDQSMRQQLRRLRKELEPLAITLGIPMDKNTFIETKERAGYRLNPSVREIAVADIKSDPPPPTRA